MADNDFDAVNRLAMEQVNKLTEGGGGAVISTSAPYKSQRSSFWDDDTSKLHTRYSPSEPAGIPVYGGSTYRGSSYLGQSFLGGKYGMDGVTETDRFYRKTLNAVYRTDTPPVIVAVPPKTVVPCNDWRKNEETVIREDGEDGEEGQQVFIEQERTFLGTSLSERIQQSKDRIRGNKGMALVTPSIPISHNTRNQLTAIFLSGVTRMASTAVISWAKERQVPYELL